MAAADLKITASRPDKKFSVGDIIPVKISVKNQADQATTIKEIKLGRGFAEIKVSMGKTEDSKPVEFTYTNIPGEVFKPDTPKDVTLEGGAEYTATIDVPALLPGQLDLAPIVWGKVELAMEPIQVGGAGRAGLAIDTNAGEMKAELWVKVAPNTAANIARLAASGFYDGLTFHRVIKGFMIQGGDPTGDGTGGPGFSLPAEFNDRKHVKGVLSMARSQHKDSAGSQFFLMHGVSPHLDGQYTAFGKVVEGLDVVDAIATTEVKRGGDGAMSAPVKKQVIKSMRLIAIDSGK